MKIGMIVAMEKELKQLRPLFPEDKVILQKSGIATVNAAVQAVELIRQYKPDVIISSGCAGGNGDDINLQDELECAKAEWYRQQARKLSLECDEMEREAQEEAGAF